VLVALTGCGFAIGASTGDAFVEPDAAIDAPGPPILLVQHASYYVTNGGAVGCTYALAQAAGNTNIAVIDWSGGTGDVMKITDTAGNSYVSTGTVTTGPYSLRIYYALGIHAAGAGTNRVTVTFTIDTSFPKLRVLEYAGLASENPFEIGTGSGGAGAVATSGAVTTTTPHTLLLAANVIAGVSTAIAPFLAADTSDGDLIETYEVRSPGTFAASGTVSSSGSWAMVLGAFRGR
jgi:hypothetical protein